MDIYDVSEMFSRYYVDPTIAQRNVPSKWQVKIHGNGQALLLVMVQNCGKMVLDRILNIGAVGMSHIWLELDGPHEEVPTLPGTTRSLPTWYWYMLPHQLDSRLACTLFGIVGAAAQSVKQVSLGGNPGGKRAGRVIEDLSPDASYSWTETSELYPEPDVVTGSHRFYRQYGNRESAAHATCHTHFLGEGQVNLHASPDSAVAKLGFGTCLTGFFNPVWVKHCRVDYRVKFGGHPRR